MRHVITLREVGVVGALLPVLEAFAIPETLLSAGSVKGSNVGTAMLS